MVSGFVKASSHNLKYCGIDALARIVRINAKYAGEHQARPALRLQCRRIFFRPSHARLCDGLPPANVHLWAMLTYFEMVA